MNFERQRISRPKGSIHNNEEKTDRTRRGSQKSQGLCLAPPLNTLFCHSPQQRLSKQRNQYTLVARFNLVACCDFVTL
jgi:hypothetical protein